jgi:hypothetical protein
MSAGRNSPTKESAKDALLHYLSGSYSKEELQALSKLTPDEAAAHHHYKIFKHPTPYSTAGTKSDCWDLVSGAIRLNHFSFVTGIASRKVRIGILLKHHPNRSPAAELYAEVGDGMKG